MNSDLYILFSGKKLLIVFLLSVCAWGSYAQQQRELNADWVCRRADEMKKSGEEISVATFSLDKFMPAVVPGTVLTTQLQNKLIPDPFYGLNNELIPDIYKVGRDYYTYWFVNDFTEKFPLKGEHMWLQFRGINYSADFFVNGHKLNDHPDKGMYLRQSFDISPYLSPTGKNRLAVIVYPPDQVGNPNGGQGGDGMIGHCITNQYTAGWDWIQPVRDRNTGIWDKVFIKRTKQVHVEHTHVVTKVPGKRQPEGNQKAVIIKVTTEVENPDSTQEVEGVAQFEIDGKKVTVNVVVAPMSSEFVEFPPLYLDSPKLWWPNGYGAQPLYDLKVSFVLKGKVLADEEHVTVGLRELKAIWNTKTNSRELRVNGQKIFIKGGNRILSDAMLRFSKERYDAEIRYHRDMNLNLIRVWGGGITERPEFYDACDKYGLMVMQDFWVSGDCNGRWYDPMKLEDTNARRAYPDDHGLFLESLDDQVRMLRNHPSLVYWCGGNEIRPPYDVLVPFRDSILPQLDSTRYFFEYSNDDSMSLKSYDGPYTIQPDKFFWEHRSFPFNSEVGSVGIGDLQSLERFIPKEHLIVPTYDPNSKTWKVDSFWKYHKYCSYDSSVEQYAHPVDIHDFTMKAQLVNYNQYRSLIEGYSANMWEWYTGVIIWKTQNPWTALLGQMYDVYLDPNACLYGLREGAMPLHIMYDKLKRNVMVVNNGFKATPALAVEEKLLDIKGNIVAQNTTYTKAAASKVSILGKIPKVWDSSIQNGGHFLSLALVDTVTSEVADENLYWMADKNGSYEWMAKMPQAKLNITARSKSPGRVEVNIENSQQQLAFFLRIAVVDATTKKRILPAFSNNNYFSVLPAESEDVRIDFKEQPGVKPMIEIEGWNFQKVYVEIKN